MFRFSLKLDKWSFHVADLPSAGKKCTEILQAREGRAKVLFWSLNMQNLWCSRCLRVVYLKLPNISPFNHERVVILHSIGREETRILP